MLTVKQLFQRDISRDIKGVIKIGQDDSVNVYQELEEYVVTAELRRHFGAFFEVYNRSIHQHTDKMGVWISGFFGSGKSHFLKILSYLLMNKELNGKPATDFFKDKIDDPITLAEMYKAGNVSTDVILFNIDSKSDTDSSTNREAILRVFNKVFNEMQGFSSSLPWLAAMEQRLVKEGTYGAFKAKFAELRGAPWEQMRDDFYFEQDVITQALAEATNMSLEAARSWAGKAEDNFSLSIEAFANRVREYIEQKGKNHHVIFFVDEMGQYIGDNANLMLNLQTVVEDLGSFCGGKAWVVVTSQQEIDTVTRVRGNDFSKIQGRFNTRLSLSSANVDEVIKKRLLLKEAVAAKSLELLYSNKQAILKNLITFTNDTADMKAYRGPEDFVAVYPFIPYQFRLLQLVFTAIRTHGASGAHLAEGERSLLSAFQEAAIAHAEADLGALVPFHSFFQTIEAFLDHSIRTVFIHATDNADLNTFDIEVLKTLFMLKWVKEVPAKLENVATLMIRHVDDDQVALKKQIEEALKKLLRQTLIQKNGSMYVFLTHEEQDVNREIQNTIVDSSAIVANIGEEIFSGIYSENRFRHSPKYSFSFNKVIDDRYLSQQRHDINLKVITPYYDRATELTDEELKLMTSRDNTLIIRLPADDTVLREAEEILKIETYHRRTAGTNTSGAADEIISRKLREVTERRERVRSLLIEALRHAAMYANGQRLDISPKQPAERINDGFSLLISNVYGKLSYIKTFIETDRDLQSLISGDGNAIRLFGEESSTANTLALQELLDYISTSTHRNIPTTLKHLLDFYEKPPYGWLANDVRGLVVVHFKAQEIMLQMGSKQVQSSDTDLFQYLTKRDNADRLLVRKRSRIPEQHLRDARMLFKEVFGTTSAPTDEDGIMDRFSSVAKEEIKDIERLLEHYESTAYPGMATLEQGKVLLSGIIKAHNVMDFFAKVHDAKEDLLTYEEKAQRVKAFFKNQKSEFDKALLQVEIFNKSETYVVDETAQEHIKNIKQIVYMPEPYSHIPQLPALVEAFRTKYSALLDTEAAPVQGIIAADQSKVMEEIKRYEFTSHLADEASDKFDDLGKRLKAAHNFYEVIAMKEESARLKLRFFETIRKEVEKKQASVKLGPRDEAVKSIYPPKKTVNVQLSQVISGVQTITSEQDIEDLLDIVRMRLKKALGENTIVKLI
ncbi:MAG: BREX system P-loop protein BrxC [Peptococcaceae bacterium]|nr:BREX system P-loop protein BrxC [Peptococcaceae bacterium]